MGICRFCSSLQNPSFNLIFDFEAHLCVDWLPLWSRIEFHRRDATLVEMLDSFSEQLRADPAPPVARIHQDHSDPRKAILVGNRRGRAAYPIVDLRDKAAIRTRIEEAVPVGRRLIPPGKAV